MEELSLREQAVLDFIKTYITEHSYPPTVRDIGAGLNIKSTSTVHTAITALQEKGYLRKPDRENTRRGLQLVSNDEENIVERTDVVDVPIVGRVAAGVPILAEENIDGNFPIPAAYAPKGTSFMLTVHGQSMIEAGIMDGDYILVQQQESAQNGEIVVAQIDGFFDSEATVKTFYRENDYIRLQPENSSMNPIIVKDCRIVGVVKGVFRYM